MKQLRYNEEHHITPRQIRKAITDMPIGSNGRSESRPTPSLSSTAPSITYNLPTTSATSQAAEALTKYNTAKTPKNPPQETREEKIARLQKEMKQAAASFDFILAAQLRDELLRLSEEDGK